MVALNPNLLIQIIYSIFIRCSYISSIYCEYFKRYKVNIIHIMSAEMYSYESDKITADSFLTPLHLSPNTDGVRDPDYMLDWMEAFDSYNFEDYSTQDCSQFNSEPFSFNEEGDLWKQFEDPVYSQTNLDYQPLTFPDYPLLPYQQETSTQLSSTADSSITYSSQTSSPGFSPNDSPSSSAEISVLRIGNKRRSIVTSSQEESSPPVVSMKRTRGLTYKKTQTQSDQGYASLSDNSSPYVSIYSLLPFNYK